MAPRPRGSQTDPSTLAGGGQVPSEVGGGGALQLLEEKNTQAYIDQLEFSEPSSSPPADNQTVYDNMAGSGTVEDPKIVTNDQELNAIRSNPASAYKLGANIDCSLTSEWNAGSGFAGFAPFEGSIFGDGYVIKGLSAKPALISYTTSAVNADRTITNFVMYDCSITEGDFSNAGALISDVFQDQDPNEFRYTFSDILVLDCSVVAPGDVGGLIGVLPTQKNVSRCAVVNTVIENTGGTSGENTGGVIGFLNSYDFNGTPDYNYVDVVSLYSYNNTFIGNGTTVGSLVAKLEHTDDVDSLEEFNTRIKNSTSAVSDPDIPVIGSVANVSSDSASTADRLYLENIYHTGSDSFAGTFNTGTPGVNNTVSLTNDEMSGESAETNAPQLDFESVWSIIEKNVNLSIYGDGYPIFDGDYNKAQAASQGLGDPFQSDIKGVTPAGELVNVSLAIASNLAQTKSPNIAQIYPGNSSALSSNQGAGAVFSSLPNQPRATDSGAGYTVCKDPQNPRGALKIGGAYTDSGGSPKTILQAFDSHLSKFYGDSDRYWTAGYPDPSDDVTSLGGVALVGKPASGAIGNYVVVAGGNDGTNDLDSIFLLDTSATTPAWTEASDTLNGTRSEAAHVVYNGELWIFGGVVNGSESTSVIKVDPTASSGNRVDTSPTNLPDSYGFARKTTVLNGKAYITGLNTTQSSERVVLEYDFDNDTYQEIPKLDGLLNPGDAVGDNTNGTGNARVFSYNNFLYVTGGYNYYDESDLAAYSPEDNQWYAVPPATNNPDDGSGNVNGSRYLDTQGPKGGVRFGKVMLFFESGNAAQDIMQMYIIPEDPREVTQ